MPYADFGEKLSFSAGSQFFKLKSKGDKLRFRLLGAPFIEGKHFTELPDGSWDIQPCPRVNENSKCDTCNKYFSIIMKAKKTGDKTLMEQAKKEAKPYQNSVAAYFPVINRDTQEFVVFQSTVGVRTKIEDEIALGKKVLEIDLVVLRTETPGSEYYKLSPVDSADTLPLTEKELSEVERYKTIDLSEMVAGAADDDSSLAIEANSEVVDEELAEEV